MSFHGQVAAAALRDGNTPEQFSSAAQKHANAFWFFAVVGVVVWYFTGLGWSLIPFGLALLTAFQSVSATLTARKLSDLIRGSGTPFDLHTLPEQIDLDDVLQVKLIDDVRESYSALLADGSDPYAGCMYRPASKLSYPKATIRRALQALLDFVEGRRNSTLLDTSIRNQEVAETLRVSLDLLDDFLDVPENSLPTDPGMNLLVGSQLRGAWSSHQLLPDPASGGHGRTGHHS